MIEFSWRGYSVGDKVRIVATSEQLKEICAEECADYVGNVVKVNDKLIYVRFLNSLRAFNKNMLEKVNGDTIDTYIEWLDSPEGDTYTNAMNAAYGEI